MIFSKEPKKHEGKVGGLFYFISIFSLSLITVFFLRFILNFITDPTVEQQWGYFPLLGSLLLGLLISFSLTGKISVFIHELKHSIVSSLAGNKSKAMSYKDETGQFEYTYTKQSSHLNAFISLAPYTLPLFVLAVLPLSFLFYSKDITLAKALLVAGFGMDLYQNFKDAGPHQSDFTETRGGYFFGMIYVLSFNLLLAGLLFLFVMFGKEGLLEFLAWLARIFLEAYVSFRGGD